jgi:Golgi nucleoside diphosphatase
MQVIDGGSTGSRLHVFEFTEDENDVEECVRRGSSRANVPLSAFGRLPSETQVHQALNVTYVAEHLLPLFEYAATVIPVEYHKTTPVKYQATAGMRLLEESEQEAVYDALYQGLIEAETFVFESMQREDIDTLAGDLEGFYGAVAANYLQGMIDTKLRLTSEESETQGPIGALDMGGSSTQIVYSMGGDEPVEAPLVCQSESDSSQSAVPRPSPSQLNGEDFFSTSYLSYGVDQFRERLWSTLVQEREKEDE